MLEMLQHNWQWCSGHLLMLLKISWIYYPPRSVALPATAKAVQGNTRLHQTVKRYGDASVAHAPRAHNRMEELDLKIVFGVTCCTLPLYDFCCPIVSTRPPPISLQSYSWCAQNAFQCICPNSRLPCKIMTSHVAGPAARLTNERAPKMTTTSRSRPTSPRSGCGFFAGLEAVRALRRCPPAVTE